ncbi:FkbM family methyltransferase [Tardiphaga sp. 804_B3_N1_9]|uniref:FkbM family methyltransferase n=1 Tax=Tardiphaga TaxID=1395974 RepID=UPI0015861235|nr:FkbM family methyltransferase [Tardiphaga robiniae]NUU41307.1 FkbM family methyltransferase [Tardiphaga robiniae]
MAKPLIALRGGLGVGPIVRTRRSDFNWELDLREGIDFSLYVAQYERRTTRFLTTHLKRGDIALDLGANIGAQTLPMAQAVGDTGRVIAVEATDYAMSKLQRNLSLNPGLTSRVTCVQAILSDSDGSENNSIYSSWPITSTAEDLDRHGVHGGVLKSTNGAFRSLDALVAELGLPNVHFIKLDVDGNELSVLRSGAETIRRYRPKMVVEFAPYLHRSVPGGFEALLQFIGDARYALYKTDGETPVMATTDAFDQIVDDGASIDLELRPLPL